MARRYVTVTYDDGRTDDLLLRPVHIVLAEEKFGELSKNAYQATMYAAYKASGASLPFRGWLESIVDSEERVEASDRPSPETD